MKFQRLMFYNFESWMCRTVHDTRWEAFRKMMTPIKRGPAKGHRVLLLTRAAKTNDGVEECWLRNYYMAGIPKELSNRRGWEYSPSNLFQ